MALEAPQVEKIAHLAMLDITAADIPEYARNLSDILAFVEPVSYTHLTLPTNIIRCRAGGGAGQ